MPWGDGTGPLGLGPMTGRGAGYCAGFPVPGYMNPYPRGFGRGRGFRWFWRRFWLTGAPVLPVAPRTVIMPEEVSLTKEEERKILEEERKAIREEIKALEKELRAIEARLKEIEKK